jgi:hypothetical protein
VKEIRASVQVLLDATHALLAAIACDDLVAAEHGLRARDGALASLARETSRVPLRAHERSALGNVARASRQAELRLAERLGELARELAEVRRARAALARPGERAARTLARV